MNKRLIKFSSSAYRRLNKVVCKAVVPLAILVLSAQIAQAGSATWNLNPTSSDWNTAVNWTPATVPDGPADTATFDMSNTTAISLSARRGSTGSLLTQALARSRSRQVPTFC